MTETQKIEIQRSFRVLYPRRSRTPLNFIQQISPEDLKTRYRTRVLETHPDRARLFGRTEQEMTERVKLVNQAYSILASYIRTRIKGQKRYYTGNTRKRRSGTTYSRYRRKRTGDHYFKGTMPNMKLLFGQYLYYSKRISWNTLIRALTWQRTQNPLFGQIAVYWKILSHQDICSILRERARAEKFGEYARRKGYISKFQCLAILGKQRKMRSFLGEYFISNNIFTQDEIEQFASEQSRHNQNAANSRSF